MRTTSYHLFSILCFLEDTFSTEGCSSQSLPVVKMCMGGAAIGKSVLMDFTSADVYTFTQCTCTVEVYGGDTLSLEEVYSPGYIQCGSSITIRDNTNDIRHIINCFGRADITYIEPNDILTIILMRHFVDANATYCYRLDIKGGESPSMQIRCDKHTTSTSTTTSTPTTAIKSERTSEESGRTSANSDSLPFCTENKCNNTTVIILASILGVCFIYSVAVTIFVLRRDKSKPNPPVNREEIYEEIQQAPHYIPVYNPSINSRPLPNPGHGKFSGEDQTKLRKTALPSQWNNTYDAYDRVEEKIGDTTYVNQRF